MSQDAEPCGIVAQAKEERARAAAAERAEREKKAAAEQAERDKRITKLTDECEKKKAESCYELGDKLGKGIGFLKKILRVEVPSRVHCLCSSGA